jgi:hypothetical protein
LPSSPAVEEAAGASVEAPSGLAEWA